MEIRTIESRNQQIEILPKCKRQMRGMSDNCALCEYDDGEFYGNCKMRGYKL